MLRSGEWLRGLQTRGTPERADDPLEGEGARSPQVRRSFARGGGQPSSMAKIRPRGARSPRARHSFALGGGQPSSEAEFHLRGR
jgi:hypothetical protein